MPLNVGIIGTGNIAPRYVIGCRKYPDDLTVVACADVDIARAQAFAGEHNLAAYTPDDLLASDTIDIVINLTPPKFHVPVSLKAIAAGKHIYSEKPLALELEDAKKIIDAALAAGVRVGCAPDTFLGGGGQTARKLIDEGAIGDPIAATAFFASHGPEAWHPSPSFFYEYGGGPMLDMGPYYVTALVNLLGPVKRVTGFARKSFTERTAGHENIKGQKIPVDVSTHLSGSIEFASGAIATIITSFDIWAHSFQRIEIFGSMGSLNVPDPNTFQGPVKLWTEATGDWIEMPLSHPDDIMRGSGVADMARGIVANKAHRASGALAYHVLEVMLAVQKSADEGRHIDIESTVAQPEPLPL